MENTRFLKSFISAVTEYTKHANEISEAAIYKNIEMLKSSVDISNFDSGSSLSALFYVSLYELMNNLNPRSNLIWSSLELLDKFCKNVVAREAFIHTYKFTSILTKLLEDDMPLEKRIKVLKIFQELTYGIKITWQEAYLSNLMLKLSEWITQSSEEEVISLSLGVLVNLCYKNLPAMYALMRSVNTKTFLLKVVKTRGQNINIRVQCCKLLIILEYTNSDILDSYILDVALVTFSNIIPTIKNEDVLLLRHIVDFFDDIRQNERFEAVLLTYTTYDQDVSEILNTLNNVTNEECVALVMEFLTSLVKLKVSSLFKLYPSIVETATSWVPRETVTSKALALIRLVVVESQKSKNSEEVLEKLDLTILISLIKEDDDVAADDASVNTTNEVEKNLTELMRVLHELVKTPFVRVKVLEIFSVEKMQVLMKTILESNNDSIVVETPRNLFQDPLTDFYVHSLAFVAELAMNKTNWLNLYKDLLNKKQLQMILATALYTGEKEVKQKVLQLISTTGFIRDCIPALADFMTELEPLVLVQEKPKVIKNTETFVNSQVTYDGMPLFSLSQEERLDSLIATIETAFQENNFTNITTSSVMELYEYKMATMRHAEKALEASLEAADNRVTNIQHRLAQITAQSNQLHKVLFNTQQCLEGTRTEKIALVKNVHELEEKNRITHAAHVQDINILKNKIVQKDHIINEKTLNIKSLEEKLQEIPLLKSKMKEMQIEIESSKKNLSEMKNLLGKLQETLHKKDESLEEKDKEIASKEKNIVALNLEIKQQIEQFQQNQKVLAEKENEVQKLSNDLKNLSRMREMIYELTASNGGL